VPRERPIAVIEAKKDAAPNRIIIDSGVDDLPVLHGRYGPSITDQPRNSRNPKDRDPKTMTLEECRALLAAAPPRPARGRFGRRGAPAKAKAAAVPAAGMPAPKAKAKAKTKAPAKAKAKAAPKAKSAPRKKSATTPAA
jgi:DNA topoisomerase-1